MIIATKEQDGSSNWNKHPGAISALASHLSYHSPLISTCIAEYYLKVLVVVKRFTRPSFPHLICKPFASLLLRGDLQPVLGYKFAIIMQISLLIKTSHYLMISNVIRHAVDSSLLCALFYDALANIFLIPTFTISLWQKSFLTSYFNAGFEAKIKIVKEVFYTLRGSI